MKTNNSVLYFGGLLLGMLVFLDLVSVWSIPSFISIILKLLTIVLLSGNMLIVFREYGYYCKVLIVLFIILSIIVGYKSDNLFFLFLFPFLLFGAKNINFRSILKFYYRIGFIFSLLNLLGSKFGLFPDTIVYANRENSVFESMGRHCLGFIWPTDGALYLFHVLLSYWLIKGLRIKWFEYIFYIVVFYIVGFYMDARLAASCILIMLLVSLFLSLKRYKVGKYLYSFLLCCIPLCALVSFLFAIYYDSSSLNWVVLDTVMSGRLKIGQESLATYGIPLLGQKIVMYGGDDNYGVYNYIDSSYFQLFIIDGFIYAVAILMFYTILSYHCFKKKDYTILFGVFVTGIAGIIAQYLTAFLLNPIILALTSRRKTFIDNR